MKNLTAIIDGVLVNLNQPETAEEYREGARLSQNLMDNEGYFFDFGGPMRTLTFENSDVPHDLTVLFFDSVINDAAVVSEVQQLSSNSSSYVSSRYMHTLAVELRREFCEQYKIGIGSIITFIGASEAGEQSE